MTPNTAIQKLKLRLNKSDSQDYDNMNLAAMVEAVNKAAIEWTRRQIHGINLSKEGDEESRMRVDDLEFLLERVDLNGTNGKLFFESEKFPVNYLWYKKILPTACKGDCQVTDFKIYYVEEANVPDLLNDWAWEPSFKWRQAFHTIAGGKLLIYTKGDFKIDKVNLTYYRKPKKFDIAGYTDENNNASVDAELEFKDDVAELIIDAAASILSGDIESINQMQINKQREEGNN